MYQLYKPLKIDATTPRQQQQQQQQQQKTTTVSKRLQKLQNRKKVRRNAKLVRTIFLSDNTHIIRIISQEAAVTLQLLILQQLHHLEETQVLRLIEPHQQQERRIAEELINH